MKRLALLLCLMAFPAAAQQCAPLEVMKEALAKQYQEQAMMLGNAGKEGETITTYFYVNRETKTWTVLAVDDKDRACIVMAGNSLRPAPGPKHAPDVKS